MCRQKNINVIIYLPAVEESVTEYNSVVDTMAKKTKKITSKASPNQRDAV